MPDFAIVASPDRPEWWSGDEWETPPQIITDLEWQFGKFDLDPCARDETAKADQYFTKEEDGLAQNWFGHVFVNPPYSDPGPWVAKAVKEADAKRAKTLLLLPAATDVGWFHDLVLPRCSVRFWRGRIKFLGWHGKPVGSPTAGSLVVRVPAMDDSWFHL